MYSVGASFKLHDKISDGKFMFRGKCVTNFMRIAGNKSVSDSKKKRVFVLMCYTCVTTLCLTLLLYVNKTWKIELRSHEKDINHNFAY